MILNQQKLQKLHIFFVLISRQGSTVVLISIVDAIQFTSLFYHYNIIILKIGIHNWKIQ